MRIIGNAGKAREVQAVASGALSTGDTVVVNSDGTVSVVAINTVTQAVGSAAVFASSMSESVSTFDSNSNKIVVVYRDHDTSFRLRAVVGTVDPSDNSISFGVSSLFTGGDAAPTGVTFDSNSNKVVIAYRDTNNSGYGTAIVATVSGTSISFGSAVVYLSAAVSGHDGDITFDSSNNKVVIAFNDTSSGDGIHKAVVGTVSGTSISFGTIAVYENTYGQNIGCVFDSVNNKIVIFYGYQFSSGRAIVGTVSGTSISFGSPATFSSGEINTQGSGKPITFDSTSGKVIFAYRDQGNSNYGTAIVGTVSGTSISFGTPAVFHSGLSLRVSPVYNPSTNKTLIAFSDANFQNGGEFVTATVSGTSLSFNSETVFEGGEADFISTVYDSNSDRVVISYEDATDSDQGRSVVIRAGSSNANLTSDNYIGTAASGAPSGQGAKINIKGAVADVPSTGFNLSGASYNSVSFSVATQSTTPTALAFNSDGTKMYVGDYSDKVFYQYSLSSAFDVSSASYDSVSFSVTSQVTFLADVTFNNNGTKMYVVGDGNDTVFQYSLSSGFDLSSASYDSVSFNVSSQAASPQGISFNSDGTKMYIVCYNNNAVYQYTLSTGFDLSSASYSSVSFSISSQITQGQGISFNNDGTKMYVGGNATDKVFEYTLSSGFDLSSASYSNISFSVAGQETNPSSISFNSDGTRMYVVGYTNDSVFQYSTSASLTAGQSYYVQTDGTLSTTAGDPSVFAGTAVAATKLIVKG